METVKEQIIQLVESIPDDLEVTCDLVFEKRHKKLNSF